MIVLLNIPSGTITTGVTSPSSGAFSVGQFTTLDIDVNITAISGTSASYQLFVDRQGADGVWYTIYTGAAMTTVSAQSVTIGVGCATNIGFGNAVRIRSTVSGTTPSITRSVSVIAK